MDDKNHQWCKNTTAEKRSEYYYKNKPKNIIKTDMSKVCVASLGHCKSQFETIEKRDYLINIYLQDLDLKKFSKFQNNQYSETRAYLADIFDYDKFDYVGVTTASWNIKYYSENKIDELEDWIDLRALNKKNTILCATTSSTLTWTEGKNSVMDWLGTPKKAKEEVISFHQKLGMEVSSREVANHNQIICHKEIYKGIENHFRENIFEYSKLFDTFRLSDFSEFSRNRLFGFFCEFSTMMFLSSQNIVSKPKEKCDNEHWFQANKIGQRDKGIYT